VNCRDVVLALGIFATCFFVLFATILLVLGLYNPTFVESFFGTARSAWVCAIAVSAFLALVAFLAARWYLDKSTRKFLRALTWFVGWIGASIFGSSFVGEFAANIEVGSGLNSFRAAAKAAHEDINPDLWWPWLLALFGLAALFLAVDYLTILEHTILRGRRTRR
jgi:hypothetical protein